MQDYINEARINYKKIEKVFCPYLENYIDFTSSGFKHLMWKSNQKPRTESVIKERIESIVFVSEILKNLGLCRNMKKKRTEIFIVLLRYIWVKNIR